MAIKFSILFKIVLVTACCMISSLDVLAVEPLEIKQLTDADKIYFGSRLTSDQIEKLQHISAHGYNMSKLPCEKIVAINKNIHFLSLVTPVFRSASTSGEVSAYAKKYSTTLARELTDTVKAFNEILPRYKQICSSTKQNPKNTESRQNQ
ncbi:MAG: hypothetical protein WCI45_10205 [Desulfuromonadales bacterium]